MDITQTFYDELASQYDKLFQDWKETTEQQAALLDGLFRRYGFDKRAKLLDCACGIGTQAIGLAALGYSVTASDLSEGALMQAKARAADKQVTIRFAQADFCALQHTFGELFDIIICMDNALPHMLCADDLKSAISSITQCLAQDGMFVASIRDYDALLLTRPAYSPPYIHKTDAGQRVSFQTWDWEDDRYRLTQYIIEDGEAVAVSRFTCAYRATRREEITELLQGCGCQTVAWLFPEETGFYQPIVVAKKPKLADV